MQNGAGKAGSCVCGHTTLFHWALYMAWQLKLAHAGIDIVMLTSVQVCTPPIPGS